MYKRDIRCKYTGASGRSSKKRSRQNRIESKCGGVQNRDDTVRGAEKECHMREV